MRFDTPPPPPALSPPTRLASAMQTDALRSAAEEMEAAFLSEMLKSAGLGEMPSSFGGGAGEEHFASFLREEQARAMVQAGGIGLAEHIFQSLIGRSHE